MGAQESVIVWLTVKGDVKVTPELWLASTLITLLEPLVSPATTTLVPQAATNASDPVKIETLCHVAPESLV